MSPVERTLHELRKKGYLASITERFIHNLKVPAGVRSDTFNLFDILALSPAPGYKIIGVQVCRGNDYSAHVRKICNQYSNNAKWFLKSGALLEIWAWRKLVVRRGGKARVWKPKIKQITIDDLEC